MALTLKKDQDDAEGKPKKTKLGKFGKSKKATTTDKPKTKAKKGSFLMKGSAAKDALKVEQEAAAVRQAQRDNDTFRFYVKPKSERRVTFLDGALDEDGDLDTVCFYEHSINNPKERYPKYPCINDPANGIECPICESGSNAYFATVFTVIIHEEWESKKDKVTHECKKQLFVAKQGAADKLRKYAKKHGGLQGVTFDISRTNEDAWNVGDDFDFLQKDSMEDIALAFPETDCTAFDYDEVIPVYDSDELVGMGFGSDTSAVGGEEAAGEDELL